MALYNPEERAILLERDGPNCFYCGLFMEPEDRSLEHLLSRCHKGPHRQENCVLAHIKCNNKAGNMSLIDKIRLRDKLMNARSEPDALQELLESI